MVDFYSILENKTIENKTLFTLQLNKHHEIFKGHFPDKPVTPGVVQLEILQELLQQILNETVVLNQLSSCKYTSILDPNIHPLVQMEVQINPLETGWKVTAVLYFEATQFTKISAIYH